MKKYEQIKCYLPPTEICEYQPNQEDLKYWNIICLKYYFQTLKYYCLGYHSEIFTRSNADISKQGRWESEILCPSNKQMNNL